MPATPTFFNRKKYKLILIPAFFFLAMAGRAQNNFNSIDSLMRSVYRADDPGCAITILENNKPVFSKGYGIASRPSKAAITPQTVFNVGSITKQFTAMAILRLEEAGKLSLDDKLRKYFPQFSTNQGNAVTIRNLLTHSSGLIDHYDYVDTKSIKHGTDVDVLHAVEKIDSFYFTPGTGYRYSNTAYCLLSLIIAKQSGMSYPDYMRQHIFIPLGMRQTFIIDMNKPLGEVATGYEKTDSGYRQSGPDESVFFTTQGDGGLYTSIEDYKKWWLGLQKGRPLSADWIRRARSPQHPIDEKIHLSYGFGWFINDIDTTRAVYHTGSNGGFRAIVYSLPATGYAVIIFSNRTGTDLEDLVKEINKILRINNKSFPKLDKLISIRRSTPIFAPCKETPLYLTSLNRNLNASAMALN